MQKKQIKWRFHSTDLLITILPSLFILAITIIYFVQLNLHLDMLVFLISPIFITYFVVRHVRLGSSYNWIDWLSIIQYSILFIIGFYSVCQYFQQLRFHPVVNAAIFLGLTGFILLYITCITLYCLLYKYERIVLSKQLYKKQIDISYEIYRECYQIYQEVKGFITFSYQVSAVQPNDQAGRDKITQQYRQMLIVQKNLLVKKQSQVYMNKFYLSQTLQIKIEALFAMYQRLFAECPTVPEEIKQFEDQITQLHDELEKAFSRELGVHYLYREIQLAIKSS